jgi:hypothetical protein
VIGVIIVVTVFCTLFLTDTIKDTNFGERYILIPEEEGIDDIKATSTYQDFAAKHGEENIEILALDRQDEAVEYHDEDHKEFKSAFMQEIDPQFRPTSGCIILVQADGEGYVFQQDAAFNVVHTVTLQEFQEGAENVDQETMDWFYRSLTKQQ